jgi:hypothetical protein
MHNPSRIALRRNCGLSALLEAGVQRTAVGGEEDGGAVMIGGSGDTATAALARR